MLIGREYKTPTPFGNGITISGEHKMDINAIPITIEAPFKSFGGMCTKYNRLALSRILLKMQPCGWLPPSDGSVRLL